MIFFFTHPPLHLYPAALVFQLFGYSLAVGKLLPTLSMLIGGLLVCVLGWRTLGVAEGALACALFLLSFDPLRISTHFTGGNLSFALAMTGLWLAYRDHPMLAGGVFGLAALVAVYVLPGAAAAGLLLWARSRSRLLSFVGAAAAVTLGGNVLFYVLAGWDYVYQVFLSQFEKGPEGSLIGYKLYHRLGFILYENRLLTAGFLPGLLVLVWDVRARLRAKRTRWTVGDVLSGRFHPWEDERAEALLMYGAWFALFWIFYASLQKHHAYYFIFVMPVFAWFSAYAYLEIGHGLIRFLLPAKPPPRQAERRKAPRPPVGRWSGHGERPLALILGAVFLTLMSVAVVEAAYKPYWLRRNGTRVERYTWQPNPYLRQLDPLVRAAFWLPYYDPRFPPLSGITHYMQHESMHVTTTDRLYATVRQHTEPDDGMFGDYGLVPLLASETGRRVAANLVDNSWYQITFGLVQIEDWIAALERDNVGLLVVRQHKRPMRYPAFTRYARENFRTVARVRDPLMGEFQFMRHKGRTEAGG